ncbi:hypothetical protein, partial [Virgibacillus halodenitrificans]|uniref:hypothetical protein n=1 Tax=Virgibacillus halodenitrificans TaxID=1482 RepID=UPI001CB997E5
YIYEKNCVRIHPECAVYKLIGVEGGKEDTARLRADVALVPGDVKASACNEINGALLLKYFTELFINKFTSHFPPIMNEQNTFVPQHLQ